METTELDRTSATEMKNGEIRSSNPTPTREGVATLSFLESGVALISLGAPTESVVTFTAERMNSLKQIIETLQRSKPLGVVIVGPSADMFTVGADLSAIRSITNAAEAESLAREGQEVFSALEKLPCLTVAAISGPCVGGGCELVLACKIRLISDQKSSQIGLPEIKLGILPGFGGTQRLPRLIGLPKALEIILAGKTLKPKQAYAAQLVHEVISYDRLRSRAERLALGEKPERAIKLSFFDRLLTFNSIGRSFVAKKARTSSAKETKGFYPAPPAALESTLKGLEVGVEEGLKFEAKELGRLLVTPESKALVRLFFLSEASKSIGKSARRALEPVRALVVGSGAMGAGIAGIMVRNDCNVILRDTSEQALARGMEQVKGFIEKIRYLSPTEKSFILNRIETTTKDSPNFGNTTIAIEAIFEELELKKKVLGEVGRAIPKEAIIATNTSSLSIDAIADAIEDPSRVVGMHYFNPVEVMPLVEIVRGKRTSDKTVALIAALSTKLGKFPIVVEDVPGFLVNRILTPYLMEAAYLLEEGVAVQDIDKAATAFGMPMGPIRLLDEVGLDVADHVAAVMEKGYGERMSGPPLVKKLLAAGRKGRKSGRGFYVFDGKNSAPSEDLNSILAIKKTASIPQSDITERLMMRLINEAVQCLDEGVAGKPGPEAASQIDLGSVMGIGFPPFRGGVLYYASSVGAKKILETLSRLETKYGKRFSIWEGIAMRAKACGSFH